MTERSDAKGPLAGVLVLDLSRILAGPTATQLLGDLGATILKIESPKGDDTRSWGPPYADAETGQLSAYFMSANRNKHSITANLKTEEGQALVRRLAQEADILIENFKPGDLARYGLDYDKISAINPTLVYCSISGHGQTGPMRDRPGYDLMAQGFGGIMSLTGAPDGAPMKVGVGIADVMCGMYATVGILAALRHAEATGEGQQIDLALVDAQMAWLINEGANYLTSGNVPARRGNAHPNIVPYDVFACSDGHVIIAVGNDTQFARFCAAIDRPDLAEAPDYATNPLRIANREPLTKAIAQTLATWKAADLITALYAVSVPAGPIHDVAQALGSDQAQARGAVIAMDQPAADDGAVRLLGNPLKLSRTPVTYRHAPPTPGADTDQLDDILSKLRRLRDC